MTDQEEVEQRVDKLLRNIEKYNSLYPEEDENRIDYGPVDISKIRNFRDFPYDYQYFIRQVGWLRYVPGYEGLSIMSTQTALKDMHPDELGEYQDGDFLETEMNIRYDNEGEHIADWANKEGMSEYILVAEDPCSYSYLAFDPATSPYTAIDIIEKDIYPSFLDYVEGQIEGPLAEVRAHEKKIAAEQIERSTKTSLFR